MSTSPGMPAQRACLWRPQSGRAAAHSGHRPAAPRRRRPPPRRRCPRPDDRGRRPGGRRVHPDLRAAEACQPHPVEHALLEVAMESLSSCRSAPMVTTRIPGVLPSSGFRRARRARRARKQCCRHPHSLNALAAGAPLRSTSVHFGPLPVHFRSTSSGLAPHGEVDWTGSGPEVGPAGTSAIQCWARGSSIHLQSTYFGPLRP